MTIQQAIEKAIEGGWKESNIPGLNYGVAFLDPLFWQSLGKAMGWKETTSFGVGGDLLDIEWKEQWHSFIRHLANSKDAESFFEKL